MFIATAHRPVATKACDPSELKSADRAIALRHGAIGPTAVSKLAEFAAPKHAFPTCGFYELQNTWIVVRVSSNVTCIDRAISLMRSVTKEV